MNPHRRTASVETFAMAHPGDVSGLALAISEGRIDPAAIIAVLAKTEGNGLDNDHTRAFCVARLQALLAPCLSVPEDALLDRMMILVSGGTEGFTQPTMWVMTAEASSQASAGGGESSALALGRAVGRELAADEIGTPAQILATAEVVTAAMHEAGLSAGEVVHVLVKCPVRADAAHATKPASRGASALGAALALGEIDAAAAAGALLEDDAVWTGRACSTAGLERARVEALVIGNAPGWTGPFAAAGGVMADLLDVAGLGGPLAELGLSGQPQLVPADVRRLGLVLVKGEPSRDDRLRGRRHVMWHDSDVHALRHFRAAMSGLLGAVLGDTRFYASAGAEHQGPPGGAVVAMIARKGEVP